MRWWFVAVFALAGCGTLDLWAAKALTGPMGASSTPGPGEPIAVRARDGIWLRGFRVRAHRPAHGTVVLLHGLGGSASFWADEALALAAAGYDAVALDGRGHGASGGLCTWGVRERDDVRDLLDRLARDGLAPPVVLYGYSLGAAVAIQAAAIDPRIDGVLAVAPFPTLEDIVQRVVWAAPHRLIERVIASAERRADFRADGVRPIDDARRLAAALVVVAGALDERVPLTEARALAVGAGAPLLVVPAATHDDVRQRCGRACGEALGALLSPPVRATTD